MDATLQPDSSCQAHEPETDPATVKIPASLKTYHASITIDYRGKGHVDFAVWEGRGNKKVLLKPWQAYLVYELTSPADVVRFNCRDGFQIKDITRNPSSTSGFSHDIPKLVGTVLQDQNGKNVISFTCERKPLPHTKRHQDGDGKTAHR